MTSDLMATFVSLEIPPIFSIFEPRLFYSFLTGAVWALVTFSYKKKAFPLLKPLRLFMDFTEHARPFL